MSIINLQRDGVWIRAIQNVGPWSTPTGDANLTANVSIPDPVVYDDVASVAVISNQTVDLDANQQINIGVQLRPPGNDKAPYRVKAYAQSWEDHQALLIIGYVSDTPSIDTPVTPHIALPFYGHFDDLIIISPVPEIDPLRDLPICFAVGMVAHTTNTLKVIYAGISAQRCATAPPTFDQSVS